MACIYFLAPYRKAKKTTKATSLYSIEFSSHFGRSEDSDQNLEVPAPISPKPMTPRRVKRRSVMQRDSSSRHSTTSRHSNVRSSTRSSRRIPQNPVTKILEQQQKMHYDNTVTSLSVEQLPNIYSNISNDNLVAVPSNYRVSNGHTNPMYQQSSTQSLNEQDDFEDLYNNRPASVRSSYSNFHGTRELNYNNSQNYYCNHATPQVPHKRGNNPNRNSLRSTAFLKNGPPAYNTQDPRFNDFETTI